MIPDWLSTKPRKVLPDKSFKADLLVNCQTLSNLDYASNTEKAQSKDVWNKKLEFLRLSAVCLLPAVCLLFPT